MIALRTWKEIDGNKDDYVSSIYSWYALLFKKAKNSIYIEDQFPFQDISITHILEERLKQEKNLKVIIVSPMKPNLPHFPLSLISKESIDDINNNLSSLRKTGGDRIKTYSLISQHPVIPEKRKEIYVHSKIMIVDDYWITIGSANMDKKGFKDSTEVNLGIISSELARQIRVQLWNEHLNLNRQGTFTEFNLDSFDNGFEEWKRLANDNGRRVRFNEPIQGHIYYYNFEEMNLPSPYPNAKK